MKLGKIELTEERLIIAAALVILVIALGIYLIFYAPLIRELRAKYTEFKLIENEVIECRTIIESAGKVYGEKVLITEEEVSEAIDELTEHGKLRGINFISMTPETIRQEKDLRYKALPIEMELESTYEALGTFLGSLDELERGLVKVKSFDIIPSEKDPSKMATDLTVEIYISGKNER